VDESRELAASSYGNLLLAKALLVSLALALGSANFFLARAPRRRPLFAIVTGEVLIAALAIAVGTTMVSIQPATDRPPASVDPRLGVAHLYGEGGESRVHGIVDLPEPGVQSYSFAVSDAATGAGREDVAQVTLTFVPPPGSDLGSEVVLAQPAEQPWIWEAQGAYTPVVGNWTVDVEVRRGRLEADEISLFLPVRRVLHPTTLPPPTTGSQLLGTLAAFTAPLPDGAAAWLLPIALLAGVAGILAWERQRARAGRANGRATRWLRIGLVVAAIATGTSLTARDVVAVTNQTPAVWEAAVNPLAADPDAIAAGSEIYRANCTSCHGATGAGDGPMAGDLVRPPVDLASIVPDRLDGELAWTIGAGIAGTQMPAFGTTLLEDERWELVAYLRDQWPRAPK
jgi:mono/diheme cytochrome c family protein